jgi:hypothetical protein
MRHMVRMQDSSSSERTVGEKREPGALPPRTLRAMRAAPAAARRQPLGLSRAARRRTLRLMLLLLDATPLPPRA